MILDDVVVKSKQDRSPGYQQRYAVYDLIHHPAEGEPVKVARVRHVGEYWYWEDLDGESVGVRSSRKSIIREVRYQIYREIQQSLNWQGEPHCNGYEWDHEHGIDGPIYRCLEHHCLPIDEEIYDIDLLEEDLRFPCQHYEDPDRPGTVLA